MSTRPSRNNYVKFERLNKLADDLEKMVTTRPVDFGELIGKEIEEEESSKEFQDKLSRIITAIDDLKENAYKEETDFILAPLLEKAGGDANVLQDLIAKIVGSNGTAPVAKEEPTDSKSSNENINKSGQPFEKTTNDSPKPNENVKPNGTHS